MGSNVGGVYPRLRKKLKTLTTMKRRREETFWILKKFTVFNANQVSGAAAEQYQVVEQPDTDRHSEPDYEPAEHSSQRPGQTFASVATGLATASLATSFACHPNPASSAAAYYTTALHELAHWSECRVGWDRKEDNYPMGELIAEMASVSWRLNSASRTPSRWRTTPAYIKNWLQAMKNDANYIFKASRQASKVCDFLLSFVKQTETEPKPELVEAA